MSEARIHAVTASELLVSLDRFAEALRNQTPEERLQGIAMGQVKLANEDMRWTVELATAHALAALALATTEGRSHGAP